MDGCLNGRATWFITLLTDLEKGERGRGRREGGWRRNGGRRKREEEGREG